MLWCQTLGELGLYADRSDTEPLVRSGKALAILTFVGLAPRRCESRDRVVELFWPGAPVSHGHHNLRQALYRLRQAVPDAPLLRIENGSLLCSEDVDFDVIEGEQALAAENFTAALELLKGCFLEGFACPDAPEVEEWIEIQRSRIGACFARAAEAVIELSLTNGNQEQALIVAEELRAANPLLETRVRPFITVLDRTGQTRRALAEYEAYRSLLASALDDDPSDDFQGYAAELEASLVPWTENGSTALPFVGRSAAWNTLLREWERAEGGSSSIVLIEGDAGLGKTRLIEEFAARVRARGGLSLSGKCYEMEQTLPYAVVSHALRSAESSKQHGQAKHAGSGGPRALEGARERGLALRTEFVDRIERLADESTVLLSCDDIHWADGESLKLLHFLTQQIADSRVLLLCTYRPAELNPLARRFTRSVASEGLGRLITLEPLRPANVEEILSTLGRFDDPQLAKSVAADLHRHTDGNPLFIAELLESLERRGDLKVESGAWMRGPHLDPDALPKTLRKILTDRVDGLSTDSRFALEVMATIADAASAEMVAPILKRSEPQTELVLVELLKARLLRRQPYSTFALAHDELRQLVYAAISDDRRREIHRAVGLALEDMGIAANSGGAARLARHFEQAGDAERARKHALSAANEAAEIGATEARRTYMDLARAFEPSAADSSGDSLTAGPLRSARKWLAYAAAILIVGTIALVATRPDGNPGAAAAPWQQGTILLVQNETGLLRPEGPYLGVVWPDEPGAGATAALEARPRELPSRLVHLPKTIEDGSHLKIARLQGEDTVQLTTGIMDDGPALWSPDQTMIAVQRGWRVDNTYRFNLEMIDSLGTSLWRITEGPQQDLLLAWSPDGTRIAFNRNVGGRHSLWITDVDGAGAINLTESLDLPAAETFHAAFGPTGNTLAVPAADESIYVIDLQARFLTRIPVHCGGTDPLAWSPNAKWLATTCQISEQSWLVVVSADGASGPHPVTRLAAKEYERIYWLGGSAHFVNDVQLREESARPPLRNGQGLRLEATARDVASSLIQVPLRWSSLDPTVASVDRHGFVRAHSPGTAHIVASAGGFRSDTVLLQVVPGPIDTLLYENWSGGIDTMRWRIVGSPKPEVHLGAGPGGGSALLSNGDYNWPSGVMSRYEFDLDAGLTVSLPVRFHFTGGHWQELELAIVHQDRALLLNHERSGVAAIASWTFLGPSPTIAEAYHTCGSSDQTWSVEAANADWHDLTLQVRPDRYMECYLDGEFLAAHEIETSDWAPRAILYLGGRSEGTTILHGPVLVTRGLRY